MRTVGHINNIFIIDWAPLVGSSNIETGGVIGDLGPWKLVREDRLIAHQ